jgi:hypothetical protein
MKDDQPVSVSIPLTEEQLRLIESTPGAIEWIEARVNQLVLADWRRMAAKFWRGTERE